MQVAPADKLTRARPELIPVGLARRSRSQAKPSRREGVLVSSTLQMYGGGYNKHDTRTVSRAWSSALALWAS